MTPSQSQNVQGSIPENGNILFEPHERIFTMMAELCDSYSDILRHVAIVEIAITMTNQSESYFNQRTCVLRIRITADHS